MGNRLKDKVALIFGAGSVAEGWGNGNATAVVFAREGAKIAAIDVKLAAAQDTVELVKKEGGTAFGVEADVTSLKDVQAAVDRTMQEYGRIDILHNNVGINIYGGPVEMEEDAWDRVLETNTKGLFLSCKAVLPIMEAQGGGSIINVSSVASITSFGRAMIGYSASKAAVNQFTRSIAVLYGAKNIRCNAVLPGLIDSARSLTRVQSAWNGDVETMRRKRSESVPMKRLGTPWDVANAALFFASDESSYVSGVTMVVDGALTCSAPQSSPD